MEQELDRLVDKVMAELAKKLAEAEGSGKAATVSIQSAQLRSQEDTQPATLSAEQSLSDRLSQLLFDEVDPARVANIPEPRWKEGLEELLASTPGRIGVWRTGTRPLTKTMLQLRVDHAAAVDAVYGEVSEGLLQEFRLFSVETTHENTETYLKRPDLGRIITEQGVSLIKERCKMKPQVQVVVSDGLSASAVEANLRDVYPALLDSLASYGLSVGTPFFVKGGRVACMDHIGEILQPDVFVLLIGERPGLVTANSMSAYMCYRPRRGTVESDRTVISNIHRGGTSPVEAGAHIGTVLKKMLEQQASGVKLSL
ncbi:ethanolamine ammonia-lyase subunit EutC [Brevibacillus fluminis]|uniref:Ethanolamine ammonia-lyase small subunit n=1 Tax=Brevibacillus fluminis TaxID=511487 RepID=A0A3M8DRG5_9BACL|nr:ethanolamine ammonia-lyase subunit EutC [Brevibacillus fluminis]RNB90730.1 ethanolamine ammonia-lyase subunit EutC [Brevibacillus fluminis]